MAPCKFVYLAAGYIAADLWVLLAPHSILTSSLLLFHLFFLCSYGLLGSSGCGKTTLLRCILGRLNLAMGEVVVLGRSPGAKGHRVPGRDVGYMPQVSSYVY